MIILKMLLNQLEFSYLSFKSKIYLLPKEYLFKVFKNLFYKMNNTNKDPKKDR